MGNLKYVLQIKYVSRFLIVSQKESSIDIEQTIKFYTTTSKANLAADLLCYHSESKLVTITAAINPWSVTLNLLASQGSIFKP